MNDSVTALVAQYRLFLPSVREGYDNLPWRRGELRSGRIPSLNKEAKVLVTNGVVAWFLLGDDSAFWGHLANFELDKKETVPAFWRVGGRAAKRESREDKVAKLMAEI